MAACYPTAARAREMLSYAPNTGHLVWRPGFGSRRTGSRAGCRSKARGHRYVRIDDVLCLEHRIAWLIVHGVLPEDEIDHINGVKDDNRMENLRVADHRTNMQNLRKALSTNKLGLLGVQERCDGKKWCARIIANGKTHHLGSFDTPERAHAAYLTAKRKLHDGCTI